MNGEHQEKKTRGLKISADFDFRHHLRDTIVLLGGKRRVADLLIKSMDLRVNETDLSMLRSYNADLITLVKDRLAGLNTMKIRRARA